MRTREEIAAAALACVGSRFRLHGRDPAHGLDCVGLVAWATGLPAPSGYAWRGGDPERIAGLLRAAGLGAISIEEAGEGDVLLLAPGAGQLHLAVLSAGGIVHADAGLRRVVEQPGRGRWPVLGAWRASDTD